VDYGYLSSEKDYFGTMKVRFQGGFGAPEPADGMLSSLIERRAALAVPLKCALRTAAV